MESSLSLSNLGALFTTENEDGSDEHQMQARLPYNDSGENDDFDGNGRRANAPLSLSGMRSSSCSDMASGLQQQRWGTEQDNREELINAQQQQQQSEEQELEREILLPATTTTMSRKALFVLRPVHRYVDLVCIGLSVLAYLLETTMNAALAIFGIGVGVGLVLGDSFRAALPMLPSVQSPQQQGMATTNNAPMAATPVPRSVPNLLPAQ